MISSLANSKVKHVRRVQSDKRYRSREQVYIVEGTRWFRELVALSPALEIVFYTEEWRQTPEHAQILQAITAPKQPVSDEVMAAMSDTETAPGVLGVVRQAPRPIPPRPSLLLILDAVTNPGNLGTMLRTAGAAGVDAVLLGPGCVDVYNPKVVRGGMGAHLRLPLHHLEWPEITRAAADTAVWLADAAGDKTYTAVSWRDPAALIIGSEAHGASGDAVRLARGRVTIPMHAATESLNAAIAAGVILFEAARQRGKWPTP